MRALVTGAAGFIGSQLCEQLLRQGDEVLGIDSFSSYYDVGQKRSNVASLMGREGFDLVEVDLRAAPLEQYTEDCEIVYHQAAQPGVRVSWSAFSSYLEHNVVATQRLLEAARATRVSRFVYASSSSVYGNAIGYPTNEQQPTRPHSPYGVSKLAGEQLARLYGENWGLKTIALRYFTVYGPGQRPDMAINRIIDAALRGKRFPLYGDGRQVRDFTYVGDVVHANLLAASADTPPGTVVNVAGGSSTDMAGLIALISQKCAREIDVVSLQEQAGDVTRTGGDIQEAKAFLDWEPLVSLSEGLDLQIDWHRQRLIRRSTEAELEKQFT